MPAPENATPPVRGRHRQAADIHDADEAVTFSRASRGYQGSAPEGPAGRQVSLKHQRPEAGGLALEAAPDRQAPAGHQERGKLAAWPGLLDRLLGMRGWPIGVILLIQVVLSVRLVHRNSAFLDEALYLSVGHLELGHIFHHASMPLVSSYMSGSPLVYPPLAALADDIGGLTGARLLSLGFILLATFLLHGVCKRLMNSRTAAFFAAALFAGIAPAQYLSAFATYDAMALCLLAVATWLGIRAVEKQGAARYALLSAGGVVIMVADAAKYAAALFDPVVLVVVALAMWRAQGRKAGLDACGAMFLAGAVPAAVGFDLSGVFFQEGVSSTTLSRVSGTDSLGAVFSLSAQATAIVAVLAVLGALLLTVKRSPRLTLVIVWVLVAAEFLAPLEQARIHTVTSLFKHVGYGAWFACIIAGYLLCEWSAGISRVVAERMLRRRGEATATKPRPNWALGLSVAVVVLAGASGLAVADNQYSQWPNARAMIAALTRYLKPGGFYLAEEPAVINYYLRDRIPFLNVDSTFAFSYTDPATGQQLVNNPGYDLAVKQGYFTAIVLRFGSTYAVDELLVRDMEADRNYRLAAMIPYHIPDGSGAYQIWVRVASPQGQPQGVTHRAAASRRHHRKPTVKA